MNITFDPTKNVKNIEKHGVSLADVAGFEWDSAATWIDQRREYGELGYIGNCLYSFNLKTP
jgi:uncharacterized DUF497 family protein